MYNPRSLKEKPVCSANGAVVRAVKKHTKVQVAIKRCYIEDQDTPHHAYILRELRIMGCLNHPNLIQLREACLWEDHLWMCMELMSCSVFNLLFNTTTGLSEGHTVRIAKEVIIRYKCVNSSLIHIYKVFGRFGLSSLQELHAPRYKV